MPQVSLPGRPAEAGSRRDPVAELDRPKQPESWHREAHPERTKVHFQKEKFSDNN